MTALSPAILALATAFLACAASLRFGLPVAGHLALAIPVARSSHVSPTPQSGGLFLMCAMALACFAAGLAAEGEWRAQALWLQAALLLTFVGWLDDRIAINAGVRMCAYVLACFGLVASGAPAPVPLTGWPWLDGAATALGLLALVNVTNFMDGVDGLVVAGYAPALAYLGWAAQDGGVAVLALALLGALAGFFVYNRPKALIFLGDCGSIPVGLLAGCLLVEHARTHGFAAAMILPLYFVSDAGLTLTRRVLRRERFWEGHRQHFYQRAFDNAQSTWSILARVGACNIGLCLLSFAASQTEGVGPVLAALSGLTLVGLLLRSLGRAAP